MMSNFLTSQTPSHKKVSRVKENVKCKLFIFLIFLGSVFLTSEKFVDTETAVKLYFTILTVLIGTLVFTLAPKTNNLRSEVQKLTSLSILKGLFIVGVLQAIYGILQYRANIRPTIMLLKLPAVLTILQESQLCYHCSFLSEFIGVSNQKG